MTPRTGEYHHVVTALKCHSARFADVTGNGCFWIEIAVTNKAQSALLPLCGRHNFLTSG
jgi:hypothetical protein